MAGATTLVLLFLIAQSVPARHGTTFHSSRHGNGRSNARRPASNSPFQVAPGQGGDQSTARTCSSASSTKQASPSLTKYSTCMIQPYVVQGCLLHGRVPIIWSLNGLLCKDSVSLDLALAKWRVDGLVGYARGLVGSAPWTLCTLLCHGEAASSANPNP